MKERSVTEQLDLAFINGGVSLFNTFPSLKAAGAKSSVCISITMQTFLLLVYLDIVKVEWAS